MRIIDAIPIGVGVARIGAKLSFSLVAQTIAIDVGVARIANAIMITIALVGIRD